MDFDEPDEADATIECPFCGEEFYDDVDQCPHCRQYVSSSDFKKTTPTWMVAIIILIIISMLLLPLVF